MSLIGILASNLFGSGAAQATQYTSNTGDRPSKLHQIQTEFQQLGQDLQSGNLTQAQADYTTLSQNLPGLTQANSSNPLVHAFQQLGRDLQAGNLQAAQGDYANVQQDAQQTATQAQGHSRHHHHAAGSQESGSNQEASGIQQAFSQLAQSLQAGSLSGAQSAFATLQNDLRQIGGFLPGSPGGGGGVSVPTNPAALPALSVSA